MKILQVNGSARTQGAHSTTIAHRISQRLLQEQPHAQLEVLDLSTHPVPVFDDNAIQALFTPANARSTAQQQRAAQSLALVEQLRNADVLVLGVPMYNFGISSQLKDWIDNVSINQETFRYTPNGPEGLLKNKRASRLCPWRPIPWYRSDTRRPTSKPGSSLSASKMCSLSMPKA